MRVLVFGSNGQLGRELAARSGAGCEVVGCGRSQVDLRRAGEVEAAVLSAPVDAVVNAAAYTAVDRAESEEETARLVNACAPEAMARACAARRLPFLHVSTDYVFDGTKVGAWTEDDPTGPLGAYGRTKLAGELAVARSGARAVTVRTSWVFAAHGRNFVRTMLGFSDREELAVVDDQHGCPTFAGDLAAFVLILATRAVEEPSLDLGGTLHFANAGPTTWRRFAEAIFERSGGARPRVRPIRTIDYPTAARRPANSVLDCAKVAEGYGVRPRHWSEALDEVLAELRVGRTE